MGEYVERNFCEKHRDEIDRRLNQGEVRFERLETKLDTLIATNKLIAGGVIGGIGTIVVTLLLRGI